MNAIKQKLVSYCKDGPLKIENVSDVHPWQMIYTLLGRFMAEWDKRAAARLCWIEASKFANGPNQHTFRMMGDAARAWQAIFEIDQHNEIHAITLLDQVRETLHDLKTTNRAIGIF